MASLVPGVSSPAIDIAAATDASNEARLRLLTHDLVERIKELNCLYGISRLVEREDISLDNLLQGVVDLIPSAWQYPEVTCARVRVRKKEFVTANFRESAWKQAETIVVDGRRVGTLEIFYVVEKPPEHEGPFLKEERDLIHGIAERLGHIIESKHADATLQRLYGRERRLRKKLQIEMQNRVDLTRQLVHELKTPLTSLMAMSQLLSDETKGTSLGKMAGYVWESASSLNARIDELHDVIRGELGKLKLNPRRVRLESILLPVIEETRALSQQHRVTIELELPRAELPEVIADADRVRQVLLNLINNACKYAASGRKVIVAASRRDDSSAVTVQVRDFGPGIARDEMKRLFKPGYLNIHAESSGGLGIGLTLCRLLVELQGGSIWAESEAGKGSSFFFTLPVPENL